MNHPYTLRTVPRRQCAPRIMHTGLLHPACTIEISIAHYEQRDATVHPRPLKHAYRRRLFLFFFNIMSSHAVNTGCPCTKIYVVADPRDACNSSLDVSLALLTDPQVVWKDAENHRRMQQQFSTRSGFIFATCHVQHPNSAWM